MSFIEIGPVRAGIANRFGVLILNQSDACKFKAPLNSVLIRIKGDNPTGLNSFFPLLYPEPYSSVHEFEFDDVDFIRDGQDKLFDLEMARRLVDIFERYQESKKINPDSLLVVHCQAGISRSSAVACGYAEFEQNTDLQDAIRNSIFTPNARVFRHLHAEIVLRRQYLKVKDIRKALNDLPDDAPVNLLFETGFTQYERAATGLIPIKDGIFGSRLILAYELDCLDVDALRLRDYADKEAIGFLVLQEGRSHPGVDEPGVLKRYREKIRADWAERYSMPMPRDCTVCEKTLLPYQKQGSTLFSWRCTKEHCDPKLQKAHEG